jgi:transcription factor 1
MDSSHFLPHHDHFYPKEPPIGPRLPLTRSSAYLGVGKLSSGLSKADNCLMVIEPREEPLVAGTDFEAYEYILRNLFVLRATGIASALKHMAPGAANILNVIKAGHPAMATIGPIDIDPDTLVNDLTIKQFVGLAKMFERWPFRPAHLFEVSHKVVHKRNV